MLMRATAKANRIPLVFRPGGAALHIVSYCTAFLCLVMIINALFVTVQPVRADDEPRVEVLPNEGQIGSTVFVRMWNFTANKQIIVIFGAGTTITTGTTIVAKEITDAFGYAVTSFPVGVYPAGSYNVIADDGTNVEIATFRIIPKITLSDSGGFVGDLLTLTGEGFAASKPVGAYIDDEKVWCGDATKTGDVTDVSFVIPPCTKGDHNIKVEDSDGNSASAIYNVQQRLTISPSSAPVGSEINLRGTGFQEKDITIYFDEQDITAVHVESDGSFSASIKVPPCPDGAHKIKADDGMSRSYCDLSVVSSVMIKPNNGHIGMSVGVQGSGFRAGFPITISFDNINIDASTVDSKGNFTYNLKIPKSRSGEHTISITDGVNVKKTTFTVESTAPLAPSLESPADLARVEKDINFRWSKVSDPSGVSYVLEIAGDAGFANTLLSTADLTQCIFDLPEDDKLLPSRKTPYYWRVRAVDGAFNEGPYSSVGSFYKGYTFSTVVSNMPDWTKYTLIGLGLILVAFMFFWLGRVLKKANAIDVDDVEAGYDQGAVMDAGWGYDPNSNDWAQQNDWTQQQR